MSNNAIERLKAEVERLPELSTDRCPISERVWREHVNKIRRLILEDDPTQFLTWQPIISTMAAIGNYCWSQTSREYLQTLPDWEELWKPAITEVPVGAPTLHGLSPPTSSALVIAAHCLALFEQRVQVSVNKLGLVFEFGGGYGCMARLLRMLGFKGQYLDYDFAVIAALARYYLSETGYQVSDSLNSSTICTSGLNCEISTVLHRPIPTDSLFLSTWALSEAPLDTRIEVLSLVDKFRYFYVVYQPEFYEVDNDQFFASMPEILRGWQWEYWEIEHLSNARALAGVRI